MDKNKQDEFEERKPIEPVPGQMCYDEILLPQSEKQEQKIDTSVAAGQIDLWHLPKLEKRQKALEELTEKMKEDSAENASQKNEKTTEKSTAKNVETEAKIQREKTEIDVELKQVFEDEFEDDLEIENDEKFLIDFEKPPKKFEKSEIKASKTHFFGNYENPFED